MDKQEFMEKLQKSLAGGLNSSQVANNVSYYQNYIDEEIRKGKSEAEVLNMLGEPRLLAKSIIEANKRSGASMGTNTIYDEEMDETEQPHVRSVRMPAWLILLIVIVILLLIVGVAFSIIAWLAPVIIPVLIVILLINTFKNLK